MRILEIANYYEHLYYISNETQNIGKSGKMFLNQSDAYLTDCSLLELLYYIRNETQNIGNSFKIFLVTNFCVF